MKKKKIPDGQMRRGGPKSLEPFSIKEVGGDEVMIEGFASTQAPDRGEEVVYIDGMDLEEYLENPIMLFYHEKKSPIGRVVSLQKRPEGLWVKAMVSNSSTEMVTYVRDLIKEKILTTFSIGFKAIEEEPDFKGVNHIKRSKLFEISVVALPMNKDCKFRVATKELNISNDLTYKDLNDMLLKQIGDTHDVPKEGTDGQSAINKPVEGLELVSSSDNAPAEEAQPDEEVVKELPTEEDSTDETGEAAPVAEDESIEVEVSATEEEKMDDENQPNPTEENTTEEKPVEEEVQQKLDTSFNAEQAVRRFIDDAEMVETGDPTVVPAWVQDQDMWKKARQASVDIWGDPSFPFIVYAYFTGGGRASGSATTAPEDGGEVVEAACTEPMKQKELPDPASGQPLQSETQNQDPHLKAAEQSNVMLGSIASLMQTMVSKLDTLCQQTAPMQSSTPANAAGLEQKEVEEFERKIFEINEKLKMLS